MLSIEAPYIETLEVDSSSSIGRKLVGAANKDIADTIKAITNENILSLIYICKALSLHITKRKYSTNCSLSNIYFFYTSVSFRFISTKFPSPT